MGKRQLRIFGKDCTQKLAEIINFQASVVLKNNTVYSGKVEQLVGENFIFRDQLRKKHSIPAKDILEMIIDKEAAY